MNESVKVRFDEISYAQSVEQLLRLGLRGNFGDGASAAAQVLLSAYSGYDWHLDVTDLSLLEGADFSCALTVIAARAIKRVEPHSVVPDGSRRFQSLAKIWRRLHIHNRWRDDCYACNGSGRAFKTDADADEGRLSECETCCGTGAVPDSAALF